MITVKVVLAILAVHWIADFVLQDVRWAADKNRNFNHLIYHTFLYSLIMTIALGCCRGLSEHMFWFGGITFLTHTIIDYGSSNVTKRLYEQKNFGTKIPNFGMFTVIGFDQLLHYVQLFLTYKLCYL